MAEHITISKEPQLPPGQNYDYLRGIAISYIEQLGSNLWTDFNIHDPGITILELLCYAITDLGYRTSFDIKDILEDQPDVVPNPALQALYTARDILTINPWTSNDYRKLLIDIAGIKNAWLKCKQCPCDDMFLYAACAKSVLQYAKTEHTIIIKGLYDVLIEFENEDGIGDLNSGKVKYNFSYLTPLSVDKQYANATLEMRFPSWQDLQDDNSYSFFLAKKELIKKIEVRVLSDDSTDIVDLSQAAFSKALRGRMFASVIIHFKGTNQTYTFPSPLPMNLWFRSDEERKALKIDQLRTVIEDLGTGGVFARYVSRIDEAGVKTDAAKASLQAHRNLCEDFCSVKAVSVQEVAICADMDVAADADIEAILAQAYYLIDQYFSPDIKFWSLKSLLDNGRTVDEIFDGPQLDNGFIDDDQLAPTQLKTELHTSDIINMLMDIPGVLAIRNFAFSPFDKTGKRGNPEPWVYKVPSNHQPRLYLEASKWLVFKNGLPFLPDNLELSDSLQVLRGINAQPHYTIDENNLPVPRGTYYPLKDYQPLQHSFPQTYGIGEAGLPPQVSEMRKAQAKQMKAYLMFFEQILVNYLSGLSRVKDLFSLDTSVKQTYFSTLLTANDVANIAPIYAEVNDMALDQAKLDGLVETPAIFTDRRNRFLNHLMGRFAEQFTDYALMLYSYSDNKMIADTTLIQNKIAFLKDFPFMSSNRARAFNYKDPLHVCDNENIAGLQLRIARLLGFNLSYGNWEFYDEHDTDGKDYERRWRLKDQQGKIMLSSSTRYYNMDAGEADRKAQKEIDNVMKYIADPDRYEIKKGKQWVLNLKDETGEIIATRKQHFKEETTAKEARDAIIKFGKDLVAGEKVYIVEHLLLRPRNKPGALFPEGDPLLGVCLDPACEMCGEEDPYSFRMTIVMNGETGLANAGIEYRRFAEETIRMEIPAHLGLKICWVSTIQLQVFEGLYCQWLSELAKPSPERQALHDKLAALLKEFNELKSVYPPARLHDCVDGNDENRVYLNQTII